MLHFLNSKNAFPQISWKATKPSNMPSSQMKTTAKMKDPTTVAFKQIYATKLKEQFFKTCVYIYIHVYICILTLSPFAALLKNLI